MKSKKLLSLAAAVFATACAAPVLLVQAPHEVTLSDNVSGDSHGFWKLRPDGVLSIEVDSVANGCVLQDFLIRSLDKTSESRQSTFSVQQPDHNDGRRAAANILTQAQKLTVEARYVHTVLVSSGSMKEPASPSQDAGSGEAVVGRDSLINGYRFDHYDFSYVSEGPGGASAYVSSHSSEWSDSANITVKWYYNGDSAVRFKWAVYATGPCDHQPY